MLREQLMQLGCGASTSSCVAVVKTRSSASVLNSVMHLLLRPSVGPFRRQSVPAGKQAPFPFPPVRGYKCHAYALIGARRRGGAGAGAASLGHVVNEVFEAVVEGSLVQPTFVMDHPLDISPLAKPHRSRPGCVERWELFIAGGLPLPLPPPSHPAFISC